VVSEPHMTVIADISLPADSFALGRLLSDVTGIETELERIVPLRETVMPLFWISGADPAVIKDVLSDDPRTIAVDQLTTTNGKTLFEVHWTTETDGLVGALVDTRGKILEASGTDKTWDFRLRFGSHSELSAFNMALTADNIAVTLRHIYNPTPRGDGAGLSTIQRETLLTAYDHGYFRVPRRTTLVALADREGISDSAYSQRIRRGIAGLIEQTLLSEESCRSE